MQYCSMDADFVLFLRSTLSHRPAKSSEDDSVSSSTPLAKPLLHVQMCARDLVPGLTEFDVLLRLCVFT